MKDQSQLKASADACLKYADDECKSIMGDLATLKRGTSLQKVMPRLRVKIHELEKNVHEFNAYRNALDT